MKDGGKADGKHFELHLNSKITYREKVNKETVKSAIDNGDHLITHKEPLRERGG